MAYILSREAIALWIVVAVIIICRSASRLIFSRKDSKGMLNSFLSDAGIAVIWPIALLSERGRGALFR